jgi:hypothetical protein
MSASKEYLVPRRSNEPEDRSRNLDDLRLKILGLVSVVLCAEERPVGDTPTLTAFVLTIDPACNPRARSCPW